MTAREIDRMIARWLGSADAEIERELDALFGVSTRKAESARLVAYLNRRFVRPLF